jgi:carboxyl-terminal processing protease
VQTAQQILSAFFDDQILYHVEFPDGSREAFVPLAEIEKQSIALVVLVGPNTYSAAEMSAASIQDWSRGTVIGETTYGKGTIQNTAPISEDLLLQVSIAKWLSPDGRWYQETGLTPDIVIRDDPATPADEVLQEALSILSTELE